MSNSTSVEATLKAAQNYVAAGWKPVPVPARQKGPVVKGWQTLRLTVSDLPKVFGTTGNIGLILGEASGGLVDIDLDCEEAIVAAPGFLTDTLMIHGRPSKPSSHWWYIASPIPNSERFLNLDGTCIAELRSTGGQTIVPPSVHPSGEVIGWEKNGLPAQIDGVALRDAIARLAVCVLLGKSWPKQPGNRQQLAMAIAGFLLRNNLPEERVVRIISGAAQLGGDEEYGKRIDGVKTTVKALAEGKNVTGGPSVADLLVDGLKVIERIGDWLKLAKVIQTKSWDPPEPFDDYTGPPFPVNALPNSVKPFVTAQADALQVPPDLIATLVISAGGAAAAKRCTVRLNQGWEEPLNLFTVLALPSGERKSPAFRVITAPLEDREQYLIETYRPDIETQKAERDVLESQLQSAKTTAAKKGSLNRTSDEMKMVIELSEKLANYRVQKLPRFLADDATSESVASLLAENDGRIAIMSTEGGLFETLAGRYAAGIPNIDVYLKGYSGDTLRVDRKSRPSEFVSKPALTLSLTVQPDVIRDIFSKSYFRGRGLLARFLYSLPKSMVGFRSINPPMVPDRLRQVWHTIIMTILKLPEPQPPEEHAINLSPEAVTVFQKFREEAEKRLRPEGDLSGIADWGNKFPGNVARLAGILHLFDNAAKFEPWNTPISTATMESAITIGNYYVEHALAAYGLMGADSNIELGRRLWAIISFDGLSRFTLRDIQQKKRRSFPMNDLTVACMVLINMGYIRPAVDNRPVGKVGRRPSPSFDVNPLVCTQNTQNNQNSPQGTNSEYFEDSEYNGEDIPEPDDDTGEV
jgi:hypothetical protein